jgi:kexin
MLRHWKRCGIIGSAAMAFGQRWMVPALAAVVSVGVLSGSETEEITSVPMRTVTGETELRIRPNQDPGARVLAIGPKEQSKARSGTPSNELKAVNRAIIPLSIANASLLDSYNVRLLRGLLDNTHMVVEGDSVASLLIALREMESDGVIPWFEFEFQGLLSYGLVPNDPLFNDQTHLNGTQDGDINAIDSWDVSAGAGVVISIVDSGAEYTHPDLVGASREDLHFDFFSGDDDPLPESAFESHGTSVAGSALAVGDNGLGVASPAFQSDYVALRVGNDTFLQSFAIVSALEWQVNAVNSSDQIWVSNNSYGTDGSRFRIPVSMSQSREASIRTATERGRGGRGTVVLFGSGNDRDLGIYGDWHESTRYAGFVGAIQENGAFTEYSTPSYALLTCAPGGLTGAGLVTVDRSGSAGYASGDYTTRATGLQGTSFSSPVVAGVAAQILSTRPALGWRDVMEIFARTAVKNDPSQFQWMTNAANYDFNPNYGFGQVDALAAITMAREWQQLPQEQDPLVVVQGNLTDQLPDGIAGNLTYNFALPSTTNVDFIIEYVELRVAVSHTEISDIQISLTSASGTQVSLPRPYLQDPDADYYEPINGFDHILGIQAYRGERAAGNWTLSISDILSNGQTGVVESVELRVYGYNGLLQPRIEDWDEAIAESSAPYEMTLVGANFNQSSVVLLDHSVVGTREIIPEFINETRLKFLVPALFLVQADVSFTVRVQNDDGETSLPRSVRVLEAPSVEVNSTFIEIQGFMAILEDPIVEAWYRLDSNPFISLDLDDDNGYFMEQAVPDAGASVAIEIMGRTRAGVVVRRTVQVARGADS